MESKEFKKVYLSSVEGPSRKGRPLGIWEDRVKDYVNEKGMRGNGVEWVRRECRNGEMEIHLLWPPPWGMHMEGAVD